MREILTTDTIILEKRRYIDNILLIGVGFLINTILIVVAIYIKEYPFQKWVFLFALLSVIQLTINIITIRKLEGKLFSLTILFLIFSFVTHLGLVIIYGFNINVDIPWNPLSTISVEMFKSASFFALCSHLFLMLGMAIVLNIKTKIAVLKPLKNGNTVNQLFLVRNIGTILFFFGLFPMLYIDFSRIILYLNGNYLDTFHLGLPGFVYILANLSNIGIIMLLIGNKQNKRNVLIILIFTTTYKGILMFTGGRGEPLLYLLTLYFIYFNFIRVLKMKPLQIIFNLSGIYIVGFLITFISQTRMMSIDDFSTFVELIKLSFIDFSPFSVMAEFGSTVITLGIAIDFFSFTKDFQYGSNYFLALLNIFPNIGGILDFTIPKTIYVNNYPGHLRSFLGGSYLGEAFYSFGYFGMFFITFIGMAVSYISIKIQELYLKQKYIQLSILLILFPNILWWTRAYFVDMVREFVWISIFIVILNLLLKHKNRSLKYKLNSN